MTTTVIGIDYATKPEKVGLALGHFDGRTHTASIDQVLSSSKKGSPAVDVVADWILQSKNSPTLLALDSPLGWPSEMSGALLAHEAGERLEVTPNKMFHRETDRAVGKLIGRQPLEVGANLIARTAYAALGFLCDLGDKTPQPICLAWDPLSHSSVSVVEVYPAATLHMHRIHLVRGPSYKKGKDLRGIQDAIVQSLREINHFRLPDDAENQIVNDHALDAVVCVLAGVDFLLGDAIPPTVEQFEAARKEGWIWVRKPS